MIYIRAEPALSVIWVKSSTAPTEPQCGVNLPPGGFITPYFPSANRDMTSSMQIAVILLMALSGEVVGRCLLTSSSPLTSYHVLLGNTRHRSPRRSPHRILTGCLLSGSRNASSAAWFGPRAATFVVWRGVTTLTPPRAPLSSQMALWVQFLAGERPLWLLAAVY